MNNDHKLVRDVLHDLAQQEIPDDMKTLWPAIQAELTTQPTRRMLRLTRLGWVTALLIVSLMVSAGAVALVQLGGTSDPGMQQIQDMDLVTQIDQSVTIDGVTVTLDWAYVDAHRAALAYQMTHDETSESSLYPIMAYGPGRLTAGAIELPPMFGGGGGNPVGDGNILFDANDNHDASVIAGEPETVTLRYELMVSVQDGPITEDQLPFGGGFGSSGGGGGGSGGGGPDNPAPTPVPDDEVDTISSGQEQPAPIGPFVFEFTVPVYPATMIEVSETLEANDISMTLVQVSVTPSMTWLTLCYDTPEGADQPWNVVAWLQSGADAEPQRSLRTDWLSQEEERACVRLGYLAAYDGAPATWTLMADRLQTQPRDFTLEEMQAALAEYGIEIAANEGAPDGPMGWHITYVPEGVDTNTAIEAALDTFTEMVEGPWKFTFDVPGME